MRGRALHLGLDVGTQGTKGLILDSQSGAVVARAARRYGLIEGLPPGAAEQHPRTWIDALGAVARELWRAARLETGELRGIGVSGQQHGLVALDEENAVVRPAKLWCDTTTADEAAELSRALARPLPAGFTASKVLWLVRHEPERWARTARVMLPHDYVNLRLSGSFTSEAGDASGTGWFDPVRRRNDERALETIDAGLAGRLAPLIDPGQPAGELRAEGAQLLGLPAGAEGCLLASGGGDNMMSAIGAGATRPGIAVASLGTSATVFGFAPRPVVDPEGLIAPFCDSTGGWLPLLCVMNATSVLEEVAAAFGRGLDELTREAATVEPGCAGVRFLPFLCGERVPDLPHAAGLIEGLRPGLLRPGVLFRAALEGVALNLRLGVERLRGLGLSVERLRVVGGGAHNTLWRSILADALEAVIEPAAEGESAALGAALLSLWTARRAAGDRITADELATRFVRTAGEAVEPDPARCASYRALGEEFRAALCRHFGSHP